MKKIRTEGLDSNLIEQYVEHFCQILEIEIPKLLIFVDDTILPTGACYENEPGDYMIVLKARADEGQMVVTLAHEMVHVKQFLCDDLAARFDTAIPYDERWWEQEALDKERMLIKSLVEHIANGGIKR